MLDNKPLSPLLFTSSGAPLLYAASFQYTATAAAILPKKWYKVHSNQPNLTQLKIIIWHCHLPRFPVFTSRDITREEQ